MTINKLWSYLDPDNNGVIANDKILDLLVFTAVVLVAYTARSLNQIQPSVDKEQLRNELIPVNNWIIKNKIKHNLTKNEYHG